MDVVCHDLNRTPRRVGGIPMLLPSALDVLVDFLGDIGMYPILFFFEGEGDGKGKGRGKGMGNSYHSTLEFTHANGLKCDWIQTGYVPPSPSPFSSNWVPYPGGFAFVTHDGS